MHVLLATQMPPAALHRTRRPESVHIGVVHVPEEALTVHPASHTHASANQSNTPLTHPARPVCTTGKSQRIELLTHDVPTKATAQGAVELQLRMVHPVPVREGGQKH